MIVFNLEIRVDIQYLIKLEDENNHERNVH